MVEASSRNITMNMPNIYWISSMHMNKNSALTYMHYQDGMNRINLLVSVVGQPVHGLKKKWLNLSSKNFVQR